MKQRPATTWVVMVLSAVLVVAGARAAAGPVRGGVLTIGLDQEPPTLDPEASASAVTGEITSNVAESLLYQGPDGKIRPWLASSYKVSPDGKSFTFVLRTDATFSDGTLVDAAAVKWNLDRIVSPHYRAGAAFSQVAGYAGSTVVDARTVRVDFHQPNAPFLVYATGAPLGLISPKSTAAQGAAVNQRPVGSGPFVVSEYVARDHLVLTRNPRYDRRAPWSDHQGPPYLDRIVWRIIPEAETRVTTLRTGETQMMSFLGAPAALLGQLEHDAAFRVERTPYPGGSRQWMLNVKLAPTDDVHVRQAISYGINRAAFADSVYKGLATPACAALTMHMLDDPSLCRIYPYDPKKAAQLFDQDGWKMGPNDIRMKDGRPLSLVINSINYGGGNQPEVELLQGQLLSLGIDARIKSQARPPFFEDMLHCTTNGTIVFWRVADWDALYSLFDSANVGNILNASCYANPEVDRLLREGRATFDPVKRRVIYDRIEHILLQQAVSVPLVDDLAVWVVRSVVTGTKYNYQAYPVLSDASIRR